MTALWWLAAAVGCAAPLYLLAFSLCKAAKRGDELLVAALSPELAEGRRVLGIHEEWMP